MELAHCMLGLLPAGVWAIPEPDFLYDLRGDGITVRDRDASA